MTDIAKHMRIFEADPSDDFVSKRTAAIKAIVAAYKKKTIVDQILDLGNAIASGFPDGKQLDPAISDIVDKSIKKESTSFVAEGQELQIFTCALTAAVLYLEESSLTASRSKLPVTDFLGLSLWSAVSFKEPLTGMDKLDQLRLELVTISKKLIYNDAVSSRDRFSIPAVKEIPVPENGEAVAYVTSIQKALVSIVNPLITNAALDREEIDILWWIMNDWSYTLSSKFSTLNDAQRGIISGIEISRLLKRIPSSAHYEMTLRSVDRSLMYTATELLDQLGTSTDQIAGLFAGKSLCEQNASSFPLITILSTKSTQANGCNVKRSLEEWCSRAILEGSIFNMASTLNENI